MDSVEFKASSGFSFNTLLLLFAALAVFEIFQWYFLKELLAQRPFGNVLLIGISISYFFYRYYALRIVISSRHVSFGHRRDKMQLIDRQTCSFEPELSESPKYINVIARDGAYCKIPLRGFSDQQKRDSEVFNTRIKSLYSMCCFDKFLCGVGDA